MRAISYSLFHVFVFSFILQILAAGANLKFSLQYKMDRNRKLNLLILSLRSFLSQRAEVASNRVLCDRIHGMVALFGQTRGRRRHGVHRCSRRRHSVKGHVRRVPLRHGKARESKPLSTTTAARIETHFQPLDTTGVAINRALPMVHSLLFSDIVSLLLKNTFSYPFPVHKDLLNKILARK